MIPTAGNWTTADRNLFFLAGNNIALSKSPGLDAHGSLLVAVNELTSPKAIARVDEFLDSGVRILLDSGIFSLTNDHKRKHRMTMNAALALAPDKIDGFEDLFNSYRACVEHFGDRLWGYIELDQGGMENKRITRQRLHDLGMNPIPVYHPMNDGWDYFDEIATNYDRMCWGNVVQADQQTRKRFLLTAWDRHRQYPDLWIHFLGFTPNQWFNALFADSCDSSSWLAPVRYAKAFKANAMLKTLSGYDTEFRYVRAADEPDVSRADARALEMSVVSTMFTQRAWRHWLGRVHDELGLDEYPGLMAGEDPATKGATP